MNETCILQVEDDENDVFFLKRAFKEAGILECLRVVTDGQEAIDYLSGTGEYADRARFPLPTLVLLDLKLPRKTGFEVLEWVREQPCFSSSAQPPDIMGAYELGANSFVVKPPSLDQRIDLANAIRSYWLNHNVVDRGR